MVLRVWWEKQVLTGASSWLLKVWFPRKQSLRWHEHVGFFRTSLNKNWYPYFKLSGFPVALFNLHLVCLVNPLFKSKSLHLCSWSPRHLDFSKPLFLQLTLLFPGSLTLPQLFLLHHMLFILPSSSLILCLFSTTVPYFCFPLCLNF